MAASGSMHVHQTAKTWLSSDSLSASAISRRYLLLIVQEVCLKSDDDCVSDAIPL